MADSTTTKDDLEEVTDRQLLVQAMGKISDLIVVVKGGFEEAVNRDSQLLARVTAIEEDRKKASGEWAEWRDDVDSRLKRNSDRATEPSEHDMATQAAIAKEVVEREAALKSEQDARAELTKKVDVIAADMVVQNGYLADIHKAAVTFWSSPTGKAVRVALWGALAGYLAHNYNIHLPGIQ